MISNKHIYVISTILLFALFFIAIFLLISEMDRLKIDGILRAFPVAIMSLIWVFFQYRVKDRFSK
jgi:hypothetical protein